MRWYRLTGLLLITVSWLQGSLWGQPWGDGFTVAGPVTGAAAYTVHSPSPAVQFHQFRGPGFAWCLGESWGVDTAGPAGQWSQTIPVAGRLWPVASAPGDLLQTWQFSSRTAAHPRAPCGN